jgi:hypothetical protein
MQAVIVAMEAMENILLRLMFLQPCLILNPREQSFNVTSLLNIVSDRTASHRDNALLELINQLLVVVTTRTVVPRC